MTVVPVPGVLVTAFQPNAFQNNAFQIGSGVAIENSYGSKGHKHAEFWQHDDDFEKQSRYDAIAILLLLD